MPSQAATALRGRLQLTGLDPEARAAMWLEIERLAAEERLTILLTTHYLEEADRLAARIAIVDHGRVVVEGTPGALKRELRSEAVTLELAGARGDELAPVVAELGAVHEVVGEGHILSARVESGGQAVPEILAALMGCGIGIASVSIATPSLDDVYLHYTGTRLRSGGRSRKSESGRARYLLGRQVRNLARLPPDFRRESERRRYAQDDWSPDPADRRPGQPWPSILGDIKPTKEGLAYAREVWRNTAGLLYGPAGSP